MQAFVGCVGGWRRYPFRIVTPSPVRGHALSLGQGGPHVNMSHIVFAWELGAGYGHISGFKPLLDRFAGRGHRVTMILRETKNAARILGDSPVDLLSAPNLNYGKSQQAPTVNYADILLRCGFDSVQRLHARVEAWLQRFRESSPDLLVVDHAPTALVAARILNIPTTLFGSGFFSPPRVAPMPCLTPWLNPQPDFLWQLEHQVLGTINRVLELYDTRALTALYQLFEVDEDFLCTLPELDHYVGRPEAAYWGPRFSLDSGECVPWPQAPGKRVFVYVSGQYKHLPALAAALGQSEASVLVHCRDQDKTVAELFTAADCVYSRAPVNMRHVTENAELVVCHGGHGTIAAALLGGIPLLLLPTQLEQLLPSIKLRDFGLATFVDPAGAPGAVRQALEEALRNEAAIQNAQRFKHHYAGFDPDEQLEEIVLACEEIIAETS